MSHWSTILREPTLNPIPRLILLHKLDQPGDETVESLCTALGLGRDRITRGLGDLMVAGLAHRHIVTESGQPPRARWRFSQVGESPTAGCPNCGIPQVQEIPTTENPDLGLNSGFDSPEAESVSRASAPAPAPASVFSPSSTQEEEKKEISKDDLSGGGGAGEEPPKRRRRTTVAYTEEFEAVWLAYGHWGEKKPAFEQWKKAITRADPEVIVEALATYIEATADDLHYRKHLQRWLRDDRWESAAPVKPKPSDKEIKSEKIRRLGSHDRWNTKMAGMTVEQAMKAYGISEQNARESIATAKAELAKKGVK